MAAEVAAEVAAAPVSMRISVIIPVYNNAETLDVLLPAVATFPGFHEIITIDDGSRDASAAIIRKYSRVRLFTHPQNRGKGAAIVRGWQEATGDVIFSIDADLLTYTHQHMSELVGGFMADNCDMIVAARGNIFPFGWVSGERIYYKFNVMPYTALAAGVGNGIEQVINYAHRGKNIKIIIANNTGHVLKYQRHSPHQAAMFYAREGWQLLKTEHQLGYPVAKSVPTKIGRKLKRLIV